MHPTLFTVGTYSVSSYTVMVVIVLIVGYVLTLHEFRRKGIDEGLLDLLACTSVILGFLGAKLLFLYQNSTFSELIAQPIQYLASGLTWWGAFVPCIFLWALIARWKKVSFWLIGDAVAPGLVLAYGIGRIACLLAGDDYGVPSNLPWALSFPNGAPPTLERVHPTQIYETLSMIIVFLFLWNIRKKDLPVGWISYVTLIIFGVERFLVEFIRNTTPSSIPGITQAQIISIGFIIFGAYKFIQLKSRSGKSVEARG